MKKTEEYRQRATDCRELSQKAPTADIRQHYLDLAIMWDRLAEERLTFFVPKET
jgi:hypothetical protein